MELDKLIYSELLEKAIKAREYSYAPYSHFKVGAALMGEDRSIYTGCNIENAAYSPTNCAERTAFFKAISEGVHRFRMIAIAGGKDEVLVSCPPCGVCRQVMMEFCDPQEFEIIFGESPQNLRVIKLIDLLPEGFGRSHLT